MEKNGQLTAGVDKDGLLAGDGVGADDGVGVENGLTALDATPCHGAVGLLDGRVDGFEAVQAFLEGRAQTPIRLGRVGKQRVAARLRLVQHVEKGGSRRLLLVGHVRVPEDGAGTSPQEAVNGLVSGTSVDEVNFGVALRCSFSATCQPAVLMDRFTRPRAAVLTRRRVDVVTAKIATKVQRLRDRQVGKVLPTERDDLALGDQARELVLSRIVQLGQLDTADLGANARCQVHNLGGILREKVRERRIGVLPMLYMLERLERRILLGGIPRREIVRVLAGC